MSKELYDLGLLLKSTLWQYALYHFSIFLEIHYSEQGRRLLVGFGFMVLAYKWCTNGAIFLKFGYRKLLEEEVCAEFITGLF